MFATSCTPAGIEVMIVTAKRLTAQPDDAARPIEEFIAL
jgi:hypothetical protein